MYTDMISLPKKKKKNYKKDCMKSLVVKPWPLGELFLALLNGRIVLGL